MSTDNFARPAATWFAPQGVVATTVSTAGRREVRGHGPGGVGPSAIPNEVRMVVRRSPVRPLYLHA